MRILFILSTFIIFSPSPLWAIVDMRNANFSDAWTDLIIPNSGYGLQVRRSYNSRTLFNGVFGFGWCSDWESKLAITADGNLSLTECGGGLELIFKPADFNEKKTRGVINQIISGVKKKNKNLKDSYYKKLRVDLEYDNKLREEFARQLDIKGSINQKVFYADGRRDEAIKIEKQFYVRTLPNGTHEKYDVKNGQLKYIYDKHGNYIKINHKRKAIVSVVDNGGNKLTFSYSKRNQKVSSIIGPNGLSAAYKHKGENLVSMRNAWKNEYSYKYDDLHNLTEIGFPDKTRKLISYNKDKDWVTSFTNRKGCKESYRYEPSKKDPLNHYTSYVRKVCNGRVTNISSYEFLYKKKKSGHRYLSRTRFENNDDITDTIYHEVFGKPTSIFKNNAKVVFHYYSPKHKLAGLLRKKSDITQTTMFYYENQCKKVSKVTRHYYQTVPPVNRKTAGGTKNLKRKIVKTVTTYFDYHKIKCNLLAAKNSLGQTAKLTYDRRGRIKTIQDQAKKLVHIKYDERFGKPNEVIRPGLGAIRVSYKSDGSINNVKSEQGTAVISQVANIFQNLLEIISPAASELTI